MASPDQIFRSTATNSTCRVATTLLGFHTAYEGVRYGVRRPRDAATVLLTL
jgi:hypothetical protein